MPDALREIAESAPAAGRGGFVAECTSMCREVCGLWRLGVAVLRRREQGSVVGWALGAVLLFGVVVDQATTSLIGIVPGIMEMNPAAAAGMELVGSPALYMLFTSLVCLPLLPFLLGRPTGFASWIVRLYASVVAAGKFLAAVNNMFVLYSVLS